jgi:hypothetical protein
MLYPSSSFSFSITPRVFACCIWKENQSSSRLNCLTLWEWVSYARVLLSCFLELVGAVVRFPGKVQHALRPLSLVPCYLSLFSHMVSPPVVSIRWIINCGEEAVATLSYPLIPFYLFKNRGYISLLTCATVASMFYYSALLLWPQQINAMYTTDIIYSGWLSVSTRPVIDREVSNSVFRRLYRVQSLWDSYLQELS